MHAFTHTHTHTHTYAHTHTYTRSHTHTHKHTHTFTTHTRIYKTRTHTHATSHRRAHSHALTLSLTHTHTYSWSLVWAGGQMRRQSGGRQRLCGLAWLLGHRLLGALSREPFLSSFRQVCTCFLSLPPTSRFVCVCPSVRYPACLPAYLSQFPSPPPSFPLPLREQTSKAHE